MRTYQLESFVNEEGVIVLPDEMRGLQRHRVKLIILDLEEKDFDPVEHLDRITGEYAELDEDDLNIESIYTQREKADEREIMFD